MLDGVAEATAASAAFVPAHYECVLTGDRLFSKVHPHEIVEDGLVLSVRGSIDGGLDGLGGDRRGATHGLTLSNRDNTSRQH